MKMKHAGKIIGLMKKHICAILLTVLIILLLTACSCEHEWANAACTTPVTCTKCGETAGDALGHKWTDANCTTSKTCSVCGATEGETTGHSWKNATCTAPKTCSVCNATEGKPAEHTWKNATCTTPKTCSTCKTTEGNALEHNWESATCTTPEKCSLCGLTNGDVKAHSYNSGKCTICGASDPNYNALIDFNNRVKIYGTYIKVNSADGVSVYITWENMSSNEIKYMSFRVELYNRVNDLLDCDISSRSSANLKQTGPIPFGKGMYHCYSYFGESGNERVFLPNISYAQYSSDEKNGWEGRYWKNVWYNSQAYYIKITGVQIEYMDGSTYSMLDRNFYDNLGIINLTIDDYIWEH